MKIPMLTVAISAAILTPGFTSTGSAAGINCPPGTIYIGGHHCRPPGHVSDPALNHKPPIVDLPSGGKKGGQGKTSNQ